MAKPKPMPTRKELALERRRRTLQAQKQAGAAWCAGWESAEKHIALRLHAALGAWLATPAPRPPLAKSLLRDRRK